MPKKYSRRPVDRDALFWKKVDRSGEHWLWVAALFGTGGYGAFSLAGKRQIGAHRYAWTTASGAPIPDGLDVLHTCDIRNCVRNDDAGVYVVRGIEYPRFGHLWLGTDADNAADKVAKGRSLTGDQNPNRMHPERVLRGEHSGNAKLTDQAVRSIRAALARGVKKPLLAERFGVTRQLIRKIELREIWKHI